MAQKLKRKRSKKWISWVFLLVLLILAGVIVFLVWDNYFNDKKDNSKEQDTAQAEGGQNKESDSENGEETIEKKKVEQYDGEDPNKADTLSGVVTYAGVNNGTLMVRVNIDQYLESGECGLRLSRGGSTIYEGLAEIIGGPSTSSCAGFDVSIDGLEGGVTEVIINLKSGERSGVIYGEVEL